MRSSPLPPLSCPPETLDLAGPHGADDAMLAAAQLAGPARIPCP
jgi:hypothetical protein